MNTWPWRTSISAWRSWSPAWSRCLRMVRKDSGAERVTLYGYCMGGTMALAYAALHPEQVYAFVAQATPVDFHDEGLLSRWTRPQWFNVDALVDAWGNLPVELMEGGFRGMDPSGAAFKWSELFRRIHDTSFVVPFLAMEQWAGDNIPFPGEAYRQYIRDCYQSNAFAGGRMTIGGRRVDLQRITCPLLVVVAEKDTIAPPSSCEALAGLVGSSERTVLRFSCGHVGLVTSTRGPKHYWLQIVGWLAAR